MSYLEDVRIVSDSITGRDLEVTEAYGDSPIRLSIVEGREQMGIRLDADALEKVARRLLNEAARLRGLPNPLIVRKFDEVI